MIVSGTVSGVEIVHHVLRMNVTWMNNAERKLMFYEIYYRTLPTGCQESVTVYCGDESTEDEAIEEVRMLSLEFPDNEYWYEGVLEG